MNEGIIEEKSGKILEFTSGGIEDAKKQRWQNDHGITEEVLHQHLAKTLHDAAKTLKISQSTLKRACRDYGINRWPTQNRKRSNNSSLNKKQDVHAAAVKKHKEGTTPALQGNITMSIKATYLNDTVAFPLSFCSSTMKYLEDQLEIRFKIPGRNISIKYQDHEGDWISIMCDSDVIYCMNVLTSCGKNVIIMQVTLKSPECNPDPGLMLFDYDTAIQAAQPSPNTTQLMFNAGNTSVGSHPQPQGFSDFTFGNDFTQLPIAASPEASLSMSIGLTREEVFKENPEPPNTTQLMFNAGNTSVGNHPQPQGVSDFAQLPNAASPVSPLLSMGHSSTGNGMCNTSVGNHPQPQGVSGFAQLPNAASPVSPLLSMGHSSTGNGMCNTSVGNHPQPQGVSGFSQLPNVASPVSPLLSMGHSSTGNGMCNTSVGSYPQPQGVSRFAQLPNAASPVSPLLSMGHSSTGNEMCNTSVGNHPQPQGVSGFAQLPNAASPVSPLLSMVHSSTGNGMCNTSVGSHPQPQGVSRFAQLPSAASPVSPLLSMGSSSTANGMCNTNVSSYPQPQGVDDQAFDFGLTQLSPNAASRMPYTYL